MLPEPNTCTATLRIASTQEDPVAEAAHVAVAHDHAIAAVGDDGRIDRVVAGGQAADLVAVAVERHVRRLDLDRDPFERCRQVTVQAVDAGGFDDDRQRVDFAARERFGPRRGGCGQGREQEQRKQGEGTDGHRVSPGSGGWQGLIPPIAGRGPDPPIFSKR
jgi:hypothetical protein